MLTDVVSAKIYLPFRPHSLLCALCLRSVLLLASPSASLLFFVCFSLLSASFCRYHLLCVCLSLYLSLSICCFISPSQSLFLVQPLLYDTSASPFLSLPIFASHFPSLCHSLYTPSSIRSAKLSISAFYGNISIKSSVKNRFVDTIRRISRDHSYQFSEKSRFVAYYAYTQPSFPYVSSFVCVHSVNLFHYVLFIFCTIRMFSLVFRTVAGCYCIPSSNAMCI